MRNTELAALGPLMIAVLFQVLISGGLFYWGRWVGRRQGGRWWRRAAWLPLLALGLALTGMIGSAVYLIRGFGVMADADPSQKARLLAENISSAMNVTACLALPAWALYLVSLITSIVGSLRRPLSPRTGD